ncbi:hypothetical protein [Dactylosporangium cerinum]
MLAEFNRSVAADRLVELLGAAGHSASVHRYTAGTRHRYEIFRVLTDTGSNSGTGSGTGAFLDRAWQQGYTDLCGAPELPRSARQIRHARQLAESAWRGVLLVSGPSRSGSPACGSPTWRPPRS